MAVGPVGANDPRSHRQRGPKIPLKETTPDRERSRTTCRRRQLETDLGWWL